MAIFIACATIICVWNECLFGIFLPTREFFTNVLGDVTITGEGLQILLLSTYGALSSEGSFATPTVTRANSL